MRPLAISIAVSALLFTCAGQNKGGAIAGRSWSGAATRFYTYTGPGHNPLAGPPAGSIISPGAPFGLNTANAWRGYGSSYRNRYNGRGYGYGGGYILAYPVFVGPSPYDYGYLPPNYPPPDYGDEGPPPQPPAVVINQNFVPDVANPVVRDYGAEDQPEQSSGLRNYQNMPPQKPPEPDATIYLIAFKDHTVVPALGWWVEGNTIKYVNLDHDINQASVALIDRDLSKKLNAQRNVEFALPPG